MYPHWMLSKNLAKSLLKIHSLQDPCEQCSPCKNLARIFQERCFHVKILHTFPCTIFQGMYLAQGSCKILAMIAFFINQGRKEFCRVAAMRPFCLMK